MAFETLRFAIENGDEDNTLYLTTGNTVRLVISIEDSTPQTQIILDSGSEIIIDKLTDFLTVEQMQQISVEDTWNVTVDGDLLILRPEQSFELSAAKPQMSLEMTIVVADDIKDYSPNLKINYPGVQGIFGEGPFRLKLQILHQIDESKANLREVIEAGYSGQDHTLQLAVSDSGEALAQEFGFALRSLSDDEIIAGDSTRFIVSFIYSDDAAEPGMGALASIEDAAAFILAKGQGASDWQVEGRADVANPNWILTPPANLPIVGIDADSMVVFRFGTVVSHLVAGLTRMDIRYENVPGYNDGYFTLGINKNPRVQISQFAASPQQIAGPGGKLLLRWHSEHAASLQLGDAPGRSGSLIDVSGLSEYPWGLDQTTTLQLLATGIPAINSKTATVMVECRLPPVIRHLEATPVANGSFPAAINVSWSVDNAQSVWLNGEEQGNHSGEKPLSADAPGRVAELTVVAGADEVSLVEHLSGQKLHFSGIAELPVNRFAISARQNKLFARDSLQGIAVYDLNSGEKLDSVPIDSGFRSPIVANDSVVAFTSQNCIHIIDAQDHSIKTLPYDGTESELALVPDSSLLVVFFRVFDGGDEGRLVVLDYQQMEIIKEVGVSKAPDLFQLVASEQHVIAMTSSDTYSLDLQSGQLTHNEMAIGTLTYSNSYQRFLQVTPGGDLLVVNPAGLDIKRIEIPLGHNGNGQHLAIDEGGKKVYINFDDGGQRGFLAWDMALETFEQVLTFAQGTVHRFAVAPDGKHLYVVVAQQGFEGEPVFKVFALDGADSSALMDLADGYYDQVITLGQDKILLTTDTTLIIDRHEYRQQSTVVLDSDDGPHPMAVLAQGAMVAVANGAEGGITTIDADKDSVIATIAVDDSVDLIAALANGKQLVVASQATQQVLLVNGLSKQVDQVDSRVVELSFTPSCMATAPVGPLAFVAGDGKLAVIDTAIMRLQYTVDIGSGNYSGLLVGADMATVYLLRSDLPSVLRLAFSAQSHEFAVNGSIELAAIPVDMVFYRNQNQLVILNQASGQAPALQRVDLTTFTLLPDAQPLDFLSAATAIGVSSGDGRFFVSGYGGLDGGGEAGGWNEGRETGQPMVALLTPEAGHLIDRIALGGQAAAVVTTTNGKVWLSHNDKGDVAVLVPSGQ